MKRSEFAPYAGLLIVGVVASLALLMESRLPIDANLHGLLELVWVAVALGALFILMLKPTLDQVERPHAADTAPLNDERFDLDRLWLQFHPDDGFSADDWDAREGV